MDLKPCTAAAVAGAIIYFATAAFSQEHAARKSGDAIIPSCRFERALCGYVDRDGSTVIPPRFDWADRFFDGRARVRSAGLYGFIDEAGSEVVPPVYDFVSAFWNGVAQIRKDGKTALINRDGQVVVPATYDHIIPLDEDHVLLSKKADLRRHRHLDFRTSVEFEESYLSVLDLTSGKETDRILGSVKFLTKELGSRYWLIVDGKYYLTDSDGKRLTEAFDYGAGLHFNRAIVGRNGRRGAIDSDGEIVVPLEFDNIFLFWPGQMDDFPERSLSRRQVRLYRSRWQDHD